MTAELGWAPAAPEDLRGAFAIAPVTIDSPLGRLSLGVLEPEAPGVAEAVSRLLLRSIEDARASRGGHLPEWLVGDIERNYISPEKVRTLWARTGHRFGVLFGGELVGTIHVARDDDTILTIDRERLNVSAGEHPGFKPEGHHHVVNLSVKHEVRRARVGTAMVDGVVRHFRGLFGGRGLWVRADPPWHAGLVGLGFVHDPSMDIFLPASAERTAGLPHAELNARYACDCVCATPQRPEALADRSRFMEEKKLQYVSFTRAFDEAPRAAAPVDLEPLEPALARDEPTLDALSRDWGLTRTARPLGVARPRDLGEVVAIVRRACATRTPLAVRGAGTSAGGQALTRGVVLSTERLTRVGSVGDDRVTVEAGVRWDDLVRATSPRGLAPPVLTGWLPATVGGTLSTGGFSKGSHAHGLQIDHVLELVVVTGDGRRVACSETQAAWLFDAALGGLGSFGVIVEATLRLVAAPAFVVVRSSEVDSSEVLLRALEDAAREPTSYHVTSFATPRSGFAVVVASSAEARSAGAAPLERYVAKARSATPPGPSTWVNVFLPRSGLGSFVDAARSVLDLEGGDALSVIPVRRSRTRPASLFRTADAPEGELVYAASITREVRGRDGARLDEECRALFGRAADLGGARYLSGALPDDERGWRAHLGADFEAVARVKRMADPRAILGAFGGPGSGSLARDP